MKRSILQAFKDSLPVFFCYFPLGIVYGLIFVEQGFSWYWAPIFSAFVFSGAIQFLALTLLVAEVSLPMIALTLFPLGIRHIFYGLTMLQRYRSAHWLLRGYLAHGLVDATYAILQHDERAEEKKALPYITTLTLLNHIYWVVGTLLGAFFSSIIALPKRLEFTLTAFLAAMALEQIIKTKEFKPLWVAVAAIVMAIVLAPHHFFLAAVIIAFCFSLLLPVRKKEMLS